MPRASGTSAEDNYLAYLCRLKKYAKLTDRAIYASDDQSCSLGCYRYIELNPVRGNQVAAVFGRRVRRGRSGRPRKQPTDE